MATPAPAKTRGRASRWLRVLAPAAVALVAVAVGLAVINGQRSGELAINSSMPAAASKGAGGEDLLLQPSPVTSAEGAAQAAGFADQVDEFALVVLARAKAVSGVFQRFAVVRFLKGDGPHVVRLRVADRPVDEGRLHMLFLRPEPLLSTTAAPNPLPSATATAAPVDTYGAGLPVAYSYQGEPAILREMPAGTDPATVELP